MDKNSHLVPVDKLRWVCDPEQFTFQCTDELTALEEFIGQDRAIKAIEFGLSIDKPGYNLFVSGLTGTGKMSVIRAHLQKVLAQRLAQGQPAPVRDWCYVYNFVAPDRPLVITLPRGKGNVFRNEMEELRQLLIAEIAKAFSAKEYAEQRDQIIGQGQGKRQQLLSALEEQARGEGFVLHPAPTGIMVIPLHREGRPITQEEYAALDNGTRRAIEAKQAQFMKQVEAAFEKASALERETAEQVRQLDLKVAEVALHYPFQKLLQEYKDIPAVAHYLEGLKKFALDNLALLRAKDGEEAPRPSLPMPIPPEALAMRDRDPWLSFKVNVLVDNSQTEGLPIVMETHPTFSNLFGKIERRALMGTYLSDHTMVKPGAVALANGGYLIVNIRDVLLNPASWEGLKRVIKNRELRVEDPVEFMGMVPPLGLKPEPIPVDVKVIVTGDAMLYDLLSRMDEDFWEIFKVKADFDFQIERTEDNMQAYACVLSDICRREGLVHLERDGVAKVLEYAARMVADQAKLSSRFGQVKDVVVEAGTLARSEKVAHGATAEHVRRAIEAKVYRSSLFAQRIRDLMREGTLIVDTEGAVVGQVNGLVVFDMGDFSFGAPSRITAKTFMGRRGVINIERESQLSGHIHDKGVLILAGYLGWKYAQDKPLSLNASICFEQSYQGVEGDSASSAEIYAILSSLAELPTKQSIAVTGSVNQKGEIQPIGGANQKIEGFFDLCREKGLTGEQGVLIPQRNVRNLMLREDVVEAVQRGQFRVWAINTIDEGIEVLIGVPAGRRTAKGNYPRGTVNYRVDRRLRELAEGIKAFASELLPP